MADQIMTKAESGLLVHFCAHDHDISHQSHAFDLLHEAVMRRCGWLC